MSLERAIDDQRLMDQVYATASDQRRDAPSSYDIIIIGSGAGGGTMAHALADDRRAHPDPRARRLRSAGRRELEPGGGLEAPALPDDRALARRARPRVPAVHALLRRRQHEVLGQRALPAAARGLPGASSTWTASRRRGRSTTTRSRRTTIAPSGCTTCAAQHGVDPTEPPRGPYPVSAGAARRRGWRRSSTQLRGTGLHPSPLPLGLLRPGEPDGCVLCNTCNSFAVQAPREERRRRLLRAPGAARGRTSRCGPTRCARRLITDARGRAGRGGRGRARRRRSCASRRRSSSSSCGAVNSRRCCCDRPTTRIPNGLANSSGLVGRRYMAHLATMMQGFHPFRQNATVFQKTVAINDFYLRGPGHAVSARPDPVAGTDARRHGADRRAVDSAVGVRRVGGARRRLAGDVGGSAERRQPRDASTPTAASGCTTGRTTSRAHERLVRETKRILRRLGFWIVMTHSHGSRNTTHQCGTLVFGTDPRDVGARSVLPHARRREPVRRRRVVLPVVGGGQPGADDRRAGAARRRSHHGDGSRSYGVSS